MVPDFIQGNISDGEEWISLPLIAEMIFFLITFRHEQTILKHAGIIKQEKV